MTIKEIAEITGANRQYITRKIKELYPELVKHGKKTIIPPEYQRDIIMKIKKSNAVGFADNHNIVQKSSLHSTKVQSERLDRLEIMVEKLIEAIPLLINNNQKQLEITQDYFSILAYCRVKSLQITFTEAQIKGKQAKKISDEQLIEIRKVKDERFGYVNSYRVDVLDKVFEL